MLLDPDPIASLEHLGRIWDVVLHRADYGGRVHRACWDGSRLPSRKADPETFPSKTIPEAHCAAPRGQVLTGRSNARRSVLRNKIPAAPSIATPIASQVERRKASEGRAQRRA